MFRGTEQGVERIRCEQDDGDIFETATGTTAATPPIVLLDTMTRVERKGGQRGGRGGGVGSTGRKLLAL